MYREKYGRQTAAIMYQAHKPVTEVAQMLIEEGASFEQATQLAQVYYQQYLSRTVTANKKKLKEASMYRLVGIVLLFSSIFLSFLTYLLIGDGGSFIGYYGLLFLGLLALIKGIIDAREAKIALKQD